MTETQTKHDLVDWDGLLDDVATALAYLRVSWKASEERCAPELHRKMVKEVYFPTLRLLAEFCSCVTVTDEAVAQEAAPASHTTGETMTVAEPYTSEEFNWARAYVTGHNAQAEEVVLAALRIAAKVADGTIEDTVAMWLPSKGGLSATIRAALTGDQP